MHKSYNITFSAIIFFLVIGLYLSACTPVEYPYPQNTRVKQNQTPKKPSNCYAKVVKPRLEVVAKDEVIWRGHILGQGNCTLRVNIYDGDNFLISKKVGFLRLIKNKPTSFSFKTAIPNVKNLKWRFITS